MWSNLSEIKLLPSILNIAFIAMISSPPPPDKYACTRLLLTHTRSHVILNTKFMLPSETFQPSLTTEIRTPHQKCILTNQKLSQTALKDWTRWPPEVPSHVIILQGCNLSLGACSFSSHIEFTYTSILVCKSNVLSKQNPQLLPLSCHVSYINASWDSWAALVHTNRTPFT